MGGGGGGVCAVQHFPPSPSIAGGFVGACLIQYYTIFLLYFLVDRKSFHCKTPSSVSAVSWDGGGSPAFTAKPAAIGKRWFIYSVCEARWQRRRQRVSTLVSFILVLSSCHFFFSFLDGVFVREIIHCLCMT